MDELPDRLRAHYRDVGNRLGLPERAPVSAVAIAERARRPEGGGVRWLDNEPNARRPRVVFAASVTLVLALGGILAVSLRHRPHTATTAGPPTELTTDSTSVAPAASATTADPETSTTTGATSSTVPASVAPASPSTTDQLAMPVSGGDVLDPTPLVTIPFGDQPGHIALQNGEFSTPTAVLPDHLIVFEARPTVGLTGRVLILDRGGQWQRDVTLDGVNGWSVNWLSGSPNGTLFVVLADNLQQSRLVALRLSGDHFVTVNSVDLANLDDADFALTPDGVQSGHGMLMSVPTGLTEQPIVQIDAAGASGHRVEVYRTVSGVSLRWTFEVDDETSQTSFNDLPRFGRFGDGAWFYEMVGYDESVQPFVALMSPGAGPHAYRLGPWTIEASDNTQIVFSRVTTDGGLQLAVVDAPASTPVGPTVGAAPPEPAPPCLASQLSVNAGAMGDGAMGNHRVVVRVTNTSDSTCELAGYPALEQVFDNRQLAPIAVPHGTYFGQPPPQTVVDPGATMEFWIGTNLACDQYTGQAADGWRTLQLDLASGTNLRFANQADLICGISVSRFGRAHD